MSGGVKPHLLAVRSLVFGTCNLLVIGVPEGWRVVDGPFPPEVDRWFVQNGVSWALAGRGNWRMAGPAAGGDTRRAVVDLSLDLRPAGPDVLAEDPAPSLVRAGSSGIWQLDGHTARWARGEVRRGVPRRSRPALAVTIGCPQTRRHLRLICEAAHAGDLETLLPALGSGIRCH